MCYNEIRHNNHITLAMRMCDFNGYVCDMMILCTSQTVVSVLSLVFSLKSLHFDK